MKFMYFLFLVLIVGCASNKTTISKEKLSSLKEIVDRNSFVVISDWARPISEYRVGSYSNPGSIINNINLLDNVNFFKVQQDSVFINLPYKGNRRMTNQLRNTPDTFNYTSGYITNSKIDRYEESFNERDKSYVLKYWIKGENEKLNCILILHPDNSSILSITSSQRTQITYTGQWEKV